MPPTRPVLRTSPSIILLALVHLCALGEPLPSPPSPSARRAAVHEPLALKKGWAPLALDRDGAKRKCLWKGPPCWARGAILVLHGGGGTAVDWCHAEPTGIAVVDAMFRAQVEFSEKAIASGFAVFSLDASDDLVRDERGLPCGKRFDATVVEGRSNVDLPFIAALLTRAIPALRPPSSSPSIFMTGESTGGFMTVRASTHFDAWVTAFAPVAACDPYGTRFDASVDTGREARGVGIDRETGKRITEPGAGRADTLTNECPWETQSPARKPPFLALHHADDGIVDLSCHEKLVAQLRAHGYPMHADLVLPSRSARNVWAHLWHAEYNSPILEFFSRYAAPPSAPGK